MASAAEQDNWVERLRGEAAERDAAIEELRALLVRGLSRSLAHRYGGGLQVDDIVQEAMLKILNSLDQFAGRSRFTTWAMTIATRVGISELRRKHYQDVSLDAISAGGSLNVEIAVDDSSTPAEKLDRNSIIQQLQQLIEANLTDKQRLAVRGFLEGLPVEEVARRTGSNRNAVYKLIHDARQRLRQGFEQAGVVAEDVGAIFA